MKKSILVIDDFAMNLRIVNEILSKDYDVYIAKSGMKAFEVLKNTKVDLIILDLVMPEMSGTDFLKILRRLDLYKDLPVIVMTGRKDLSSFKDAYAHGIIDYIGKPFEKETLLNKVKKAFLKVNIDENYE